MTILANPHVSQLIPYQIGKPITELNRETGLTDIIKLASNENPLGPSEQVLHAARQALQEIAFYPDGNAYELKQNLAKFYNFLEENFTIGNGSENLLEIIAKSFLCPGDNVIIPKFSFATTSLVVKVLGIEIQESEVINWQVDIENIFEKINEKTKIIFLVNPNNPTGTYINKQNFENLLRNISKKILIVVDEAYAEYIQDETYPHAIHYLRDYPNLIILRTFSKAYGLAGLRIGYAISSKTIADILNRARLPFNSNHIALKAAVAALADQEHIQKTFKLNKLGMQQLLDALRNCNIEFIPSVANFIAVNLGHQAEAYYQKLLNFGIIVRPLQSYGMNQYLRISIGTREQNQRLINILSRIKC